MTVSHKNPVSEGHNLIRPIMDQRAVECLFASFSFVLYSKLLSVLSITKI